MKLGRILITVMAGLALALAGSIPAAGADQAAVAVSRQDTATQHTIEPAKFGRCLASTAARSFPDKPTAEQVRAWLNSDEFVATSDDCDAERTECARGGDCSAYMCCNFGGPFCEVSNQRTRSAILPLKWI